ncbi:MAG: tRNA lysidine(34) synthetase TilS [Bacteroidales bacterium]|nr:tRNA lysidine(34) synthetase TilS [Bacteroidales bacterium]
MPADNLLQRFIEHRQQTALFQPYDNVLLAVSGGVDSVVMAHMFAQAGYHFGIAHCNFHLRGADSNSDEEFVMSLAQQYNVPFHCVQFQTTSYAKEHKLSIEEAARKLRYDFFAHTAAENGYIYIATAHHNNDAIETFFINLMRGTGISGLHGILPKNSNIIRPLLPFSRLEISQYAAQHQLPFHEDCTNAETIFLRNKIRHSLLPLLKEISPQIEHTMMRNMANIAGAEQIYQQAVEQKRQQLLHHSGDTITILKSDLYQLQPCSTYLFEMLRPFGFSAAAVADIIDALKNTGRQFHTHSHTLLIDRDGLIIKPSVGRESDAQFVIAEGTRAISEPVCLTFEPANAFALQMLKTDSNTIIVDASLLKYPLALRKWANGDRFRPFGMKNSRKVSDFFKDARLSRFEKEQKWLLCNADGQIIWIVGMRMDDRFRLTATTATAMIITLSKN